MEKEQSPLIKTCSICGEIKPLAAFLQMSATSGTEYGSVCVDCRKKGADKPRVPESDETTQSSSGVVIDSKNKLQADIDKRELREQTEEDYYEERDLNESEQLIRSDKIDQKASQEKQHRQSFLGGNSVLGTTKKNPAGESRWQTERVNAEQTTQAEAQEKEVDESSTKDLSFGLKQKHGISAKEGIAFKQGAAFKSFSTMLGKSATFSHTEKPATTIAQEMENKFGPGKKK